MSYPITRSMVNSWAEFYQQENTKRHYLGMSEIGHECELKLWLNFRSVEKATFPANVILKFEDGHHSEDATATRLMRTPSVELQPFDPSTGKQWAYQSFGGHFKGHGDGVIFIDQGGALAHTAIWEHKCTEQKYFNRLNKLITTNEKEALKKWNNVYYVQAQMYMGYSAIHSHFMTVATAGSREYLELWTNFDEQVFNEYNDRAKSIIESVEAPQRVRDSIGFPCNICNHKEVCHEKKTPPPSCKNCINGSACINSGEWVCGTNGKRPDSFICDKHLYNPEILKNALTQFDFDDGGVTYEDKETGQIIINQIETSKHTNGYTSQELHNLFNERVNNEV